MMIRAWVYAAPAVYERSLKSQTKNTLPITTIPLSPFHRHISLHHMPG